jgi:alpha-glucosidase
MEKGKMARRSLSPSLNFPHHDGSGLYVSPRAPMVGEKVTLKVRVPKSYLFAKLFIRVYEDGEPRSYELSLERTGEVEDWWKVELVMVNKVMRYRFVFLDNDKYEWLNGRGLTDHDVHSNNDFVIFSGTRAPDWVRSSVFYQIFPDRFATSPHKKQLPDWAVPREWDEIPAQKRSEISTEFYGGDLYGVRDHLDHIEALGVNAIYFTPFFPARSNHRYDASSFDEVDPLLGGDEALQELVAAAKSRSIRILGDLTSNHCGAGHPWLARALQDRDSVERSFFYWDSTVKHGFVGWWGVASLPKLNFNSLKLRQLMYEAPDSIVKKWLRPDKGLAGWRIDVGNMTGRLAGDDLHDEVMRGIRKAIDELGNDYWLVAENGDFIASDLDGFGWHGAMNYQGFLRPVWNWLHTNTTIGGGFQGLPFSMPNFSGDQLVDSMREFSAAVPWDSFISCMLLLDSHDTARMRTVVNGDHNRHLSGLALVLTYPGVPSIYAGDEFGLEGDNGESGRRTISWDKQSQWDEAFLDAIKQLIALRRTQHALSDGGLRWLAIADDYLLFARESEKQTLLIFISRTGVDVDIDLSSFGFIIAKTLYGPSQGGDTLRIAAHEATAGIWHIL